MRSELAALPSQVDTIAEVRELYRAAEARAARMRLLYNAGRVLAEADASEIEAVLQRCAERLAFFVGRTAATVTLGDEGKGIGITAPGRSLPILARLAIPDLAHADAVADHEDRDTFQMYLELMGATIDRINRDSERTHLLATLREREQRLEMLVGRIFSAQEEERQRVSRDLHDGVAQTATALARLLEGAGSGSGVDIPAAERARLAEIARALVTELREVIGGLRPALLDDLGVEAALQALAQGLQEDGYTVRVAMDRLPERLPVMIETALFRVAQEAVTNIRKHAGTGCAVTVELLIAGRRADRLLRISDTGRGACANPALSAAPGEHVGIDGMRERMTAIGGRLDWRAGHKGGVTVTAYLPDTP
jgi:signal transduction histidine kinase